MSEIGKKPWRFRRYTEMLYSFGVLYVIKKGLQRVFRELCSTFTEIKDRTEARRHREKSLEVLLIPSVFRPTLGEAFRASLRQQFFINNSQKSQYKEYIQSFNPQSAALIIAQADQTCKHVFDLLGSGPFYMGDKINWHLDFKTGHGWNPAHYYKRIHPASFPGGYDIKVPWELSRCQHFVWLGQAYWITDKERYGVEFVNQVLDWIESNPWPLGVNWACTMDVAIRAVNWLWGLAYFLDFPGLTDEILIKILFCLWQHGRHILNNLEVMHGLTTNHYLADLVGVTYLGILLPQYKEAASWQDFSLRELEKEIIQQVYSDGVNFEASISYHRLATELFLNAVLLARLNQYTFSAAFMTRLEKMLEFTMYVTRPDGSVPLIGDNDNGRVFRLKVWQDPDREWSDHRYLLAIGAVLFNRQDFGQAAGDQWEEAIWLFGQKAIQILHGLEGKSLSRLSRRAFPDSGIYILRHDEQHMIVDAGSNGQNGLGGHAHNDTLSVVLYTCGQPFLVDPGTFTYTGDYNVRNQFRSTAFHNTVMVDGQEQNQFLPEQLFSLGKPPPVRILRWEEDAENIIFEGESEAYLRLPQPIVHRRSIHFYKRSGKWQIEDRLDGEGIHRFEIHWHMLKLVNVDQKCRLELAVFQPQDVDVQKRVEKGIIAVGYGKSIVGDHIIYKLTTHAPVRIVTTILITGHFYTR
jgi:hypothetical protein